MNLVKQFRIVSVDPFVSDCVQSTVDTPVQLILWDEHQPREDRENYSILLIDYANLDKHNISLHMDKQLVSGSLLTCALETHLLSTCSPPSPNAGLLDRSHMTTRDLVIVQLSTEERIVPAWNMKPAGKHVYNRRLLKLVSFGTRYNSLFAFSCPWYELAISLTDKEYHFCRQLPPSTYFTVKFVVS